MVNFLAAQVLMGTNPTPLRRCWAEIDLAALRHNVATIRAQLAAEVRLMAVVKANAYGHGSRGVVPALAGNVEMFGVANLGEALEVRRFAPNTPILLLSPALPDEREDIVANGFIPSISNVAEARAFSTQSNGRTVPVHLIVDTGMGRIGVWEEEALAVAREIAAVPGVALEGIASHFPVADEDAAFTETQIARFQRIAAQLRKIAPAQPIVHLENSAGIISFSAAAGDLVRAGLILYGSSPIPEFQHYLRPILTWKTRISLVRSVGAGRSVSYGRTFITPCPMRLATLAVGYADGYQRHLSNRGSDVLIRGRRCAVLGRVTMDQVVVDVTALPEVGPGEEVVLLGAQGTEEILASELAEKAGTIPWEIFTSLGRRVERVYQ
jgi:alanine racemase